MRSATLARTLFFWAGVAFLFAVKDTANAQQSAGVGLAPPRFELFLAPGERKTERFVAFTTEDRAIQVKAELFDYIQDGKGTIRFLPPGHAPYTLFPYIQIALDPFAVQKDRDHELPFTVTAPKNGEGSYWIALSLTSQYAPRTRVKGVVVGQQVRVLAGIYVTVKGTERPAAELLNPTWVRKPDKRGAVRWFFNVQLKNTGNTYLRLEPELFLKDQTGKTIYRKKLNEILILRGADVRMEIPFLEMKPGAVVGGVEFRSTGPAPIHLFAPLYAEAPLQ